MIKTFLNPEGHQNPNNGSKVNAILLKGLILPVGGATAVEGLRSTGLPSIVLKLFTEVHCIGNKCSVIQWIKMQTSALL